MSHTNSTANLSLPQFIGSDKPTWLGDVNGAFSAIDSYAGTNDAAVAAAASDATSAISQASAAVSTANTANTTAGNASTVANNAIGVANNAVAIAGTVDSKVGLLADLNTTDRTSIVNAINEVNGKDAGDIAYDNSGSGLTATNVQDAIDEVAQGGGSGSVSVNSDGVKTYSQILDALFALVDPAKVNAKSAFAYGDSTWTNVFPINLFGTYYAFNRIKISGSISESTYVTVKTSGSTLERYDGTYHDDSAIVAPAAHTFRIIY